MSTLTGLPGPHTPENLPAVCLAILAKTADPSLQSAWRRERNGARGILRRTRREGYYASATALWDLDWAVDTLEWILEAEDADARSGDPFAEEALK